MAACLPAELASVQYKSSFLHLQPRQMTVRLTEITRETPRRRLELRRQLQQQQQQVAVQRKVMLDYSFLVLTPLRRTG